MHLMDNNRFDTGYFSTTPRPMIVHYQPQIVNIIQAQVRQRAYILPDIAWHSYIDQQQRAN